MIKTENGKYYLTAGDACYILGTDGSGALCHYYSGRRIEPEDDIAYLCAPTPFSDGFTVAGAEIADGKPTAPIPLLRGGKNTLVVTLARGKLEKKIYITPLPRGGFARRSVIENTGGRAVALEPETVAVFANPLAPLTEIESGVFIAVSETGEENSGNTCGILSAFGDGELIAERIEDGVVVKLGCCVTLAAGEKYYSPEILMAFSDGGYGGMSRILHDIRRENGSGEGYKRSRVTLFCPHIAKDKIAAACAKAGELGCDVLAAEYGEQSEAELELFASSCFECGIKFGLRIPERALPASGETEFMRRVYALAKKLGCEYMIADVPPKRVRAFAPVMYELAHGDSGLAVEWGAAPASMRYVYSLCYPPAVLRNIIKPGKKSLKTAFDYATLGNIGYELDPLAVSQETARAVRAQIFSYQDDAPTVLGGDLYRADGNGYIAVSKDKANAYAVLTCGQTPRRVKLFGLDEHNLYYVREADKTFSGAALMSCGIPVDGSSVAETVCLHLRQVADYD